MLLLAGLVAIGCTHPAPLIERNAATAGSEQARTAVMASRRVSEPLVYGPEVPMADYPWQVGLRVMIHGSPFRCGGTLIAPDWVLTAAHCVDRNETGPRDIVLPGEVTVFHGDRSFGAGVSRQLDHTRLIDVHDSWKNSQQPSSAFDVALLHLAQPISGATVAPVRSIAINAGSAVVSGWGRFDRTNVLSATLRAASLPVISNEECRTALPLQRHLVIDSTLCTRSRSNDACRGDSGGPLVIGSRQRPQLIGITSWGPLSNCAQPDAQGALVGAFTRASSIAAWVAERTGVPATVTSAAPDSLMDVRPIRQGGVDR